MKGGGGGRNKITRSNVYGVPFVSKVSIFERDV